MSNEPLLTPRHARLPPKNQQQGRHDEKMEEFYGSNVQWLWLRSKSEIRVHLDFYPISRSKCDEQKIISSTFSIFVFSWLSDQRCHSCGRMTRYRNEIKFPPIWDLRRVHFDFDRFDFFLLCHQLVFTATFDWKFPIHIDTAFQSKSFNVEDLHWRTWHINLIAIHWLWLKLRILKVLVLNDAIFTASATEIWCDQEMKT